MNSIVLCLVTGLIAVSAHAQSAGEWLAAEKGVALSRVKASISRSDAAPGSVIASPSRREPDYYYHWVRDGGLVIDSLIGELERTGDAVAKRKILEYVDFSARNQQTRTLTGLGEPKFYVDGRSYDKPWGRPQNDGPALRAIALMHLARILLASGDAQDADFVRTRLYNGKLDGQSIIKNDLEYVSHRWQDPSFDLWEEVLGDHFYTRMVQRRALIEGAALATTLGDAGAADWYRQQAKALSAAIEQHWDPSLGVIVPTLRVKGGARDKQNLDTAILLGALHGDAGDGFYSVRSPRVQSTMRKLIERFRAEYAINSARSTIPGIAIGRYPNDVYSGQTGNDRGNPWVLATLAFAEAYYRMGQPQLAEPFVLRVKAHANADGSLSEQIHRDTGQMISASDLTWNYAAILTTDAARRKVR